MATAVSSVAVAAHAGARSPVSSLASLPAPTLQKPGAAPTPLRVSAPGATFMPPRNGRSSSGLVASTSHGFCFRSDSGFHGWAQTWSITSWTEPQEVDLDHLVEKDGKAVLERTRLVVDPTSSTAVAKSRATVELREVARNDAGVVVWAYRQGRDVVVLARRVDSGTEAPAPGARAAKDDEPDVPFISSEECPYAGARIDASRPEAGAAAQLAGSLPPRGTGKDKVTPRFFVDASLSRVARDPEPMLAVRLRMRE